MISKNLIERSAIALLLSLSFTAKAAIFEDITSQTGLPSKGRESFVTMDFDNDGLVDILTPGALFKNTSAQGKITFRDITEEAGLKNYLRDDAYPVAADFNNDGRIDIVTTAGFLLLQTADGKFLESSKQLGLDLDKTTHTLSVGDINHDGFVDIIAGINEVYEKSQFFPPKVYRNNQGKSFSEISAQLGMNQYQGYPRGIVWADFDNDQNPDIFFSNYRLRPSFLFKGHQGTFTEMAEHYHVKGEYDPEKYYDDVMKRKFGPIWGHATGAVWADFNNDGNLDLWVSKLAHKYVGPDGQGSYDYRGYVCDDTKIFKNLGAPSYLFQDMRPTSGLPVKPIAGPGKYQGDELFFHTTAADIDNDGLVDVFVSQVYDLAYAYTYLFKNKGDFKFEDISQAEKTRLIGSRAAAFADFDNDGKMDLIQSGEPAVGKEAEVHLFHNISKTGNHYLKVKLIGRQSGRTPVTTQVRVFHSKGLFLKQFEGVTGVMGQQNDSTLHFGLGPITSIDHIEVRWSSGQTQIVKNIKADQTITITEP